MSNDKKSITITSLTDYITAINELAASNEEHRYIYRGQKNEDWNVQSSALRRLRNHPLKYPVLLLSLFRSYIHQIIDEAQLRHPNTYSNLTPLQCMAHLQHNRAATGLIDFTYNPLVALWFACETEGTTDGKVFVVNVQPDTIREVTTKTALGQELKAFFEEADQWHLWQPAISNPTLDSQRFTVQQSVFLFGAPEVEKSMIEQEIIIPHERKHKETILQELDRMGISEKTLFPDLAGFLERNTAQSDYNAELADHYYTEEIRKESQREPMRKEVQSKNYFQRGNFRSALVKYEKAIADYGKAIDLKPDGAAAYINRGLAKQALGRAAEAVTDYDRAIDLKPYLAAAYSNRGNAKQALGRNTEALADHDRAIALAPDFAEAYSNRGNAKCSLKEYDSALADYGRAIALAPDFAKTYYNRGNAKCDLEEYASALADYDRAIELNSDYVEAYINRGLAKQALGRTAEALADYDRAIALAPDDATAYNNRGEAKQALGRTAEAVADFKHVLKLAQQQENQKVAQYAEAKINELESA